MKNRNVLRLLVLVMALVMTLVVASCNKPTDTDGTTTEAPHEHAFDAGKVTKEATCTEKGVKTFTCACGETKTEEIKALGHNTEGTVAHKDATCTEAGVEGGTYCTRCNEGKAAAEKVIAALGHDMQETVAAVEPTCGTAGNTKGEKCSRCDHEIKSETIEATGKHTWGTEIIETITAPTCGVAGEGKVKCEHCDATNNVEIPALVHDQDEVVPGKAATCVENGVTDGKKCSKCGEIQVAGDVIPATGIHTPGEAADCENAQTCTVCSIVVTPALGHSWNEGEVTTEPGEETAGVKTFTCSECGSTKTETLAPLGHQHELHGVVETQVKDPTCLETGLVEKRCDGCGELLETVEVPALGHTEEVIPAVAPTCVNDGLKEGIKCSVCGDIVKAQEVDPKTGHTEEAIPAVDPTCSTTGLTAGKKCSVCGEILEAQTEVAIDPAKHVFADRFEKKWGVCTLCDFVEANHEHSIKDGKCEYCTYVYETIEVSSTFDNDGDGTNDVFYFAAALPEAFTGEDVIWIDAFNDALKDGNHMEYDEIRAGSGTLPYPHVYCYDQSDDTLVYTINVEKAGVYSVAVHYRIKDQKVRGAKFVVNEGTANEQSINHTYGWGTADEAYECRNNDFLIGSYMTGLSFNLQEGENTITIRVADGVAKSEHFRDLYLVLVEETPEA